MTEDYKIYYLVLKGETSPWNVGYVLEDLEKQKIKFEYKYNREFEIIEKPKEEPNEPLEDVEPTDKRTPDDTK